MNIDLTDTTSSEIFNALLDARRRSGSPAMGAVLTLVIVTDEDGVYDAVRAATAASREHPSRILVAVGRPGRSDARLDAEVRTTGEQGPGEVVLLRLRGELAAHPDSVVLPLLLTDAPVVTWWPRAAPANPAEDPLGKLAQRRITDSAAVDNPLEVLAQRRAGYTPGDTDLSWTRITPWRTLLASALDEPLSTPLAIEVAGEPESPSAELLALWLGSRLGVEATRSISAGPGITEARLVTAEGDITITRGDGRVATLHRPGSPVRSLALPRRPLTELLAEELRRLDADEVYGEVVGLVGGPTGGDSVAVVEGRGAQQDAADSAGASGPQGGDGSDDGSDGTAGTAGTAGNGA